MLPPCVHKFTAEANQRKGNFSIKRRQLNIRKERVDVELPERVYS